ncbi:hypothetical protein M6B38_175170 [Iris pallida]|uniref:Uncharacterized protein n=1 Tax=Iris pallida TaxID=29817 RepID=A0AAX6EQB1_IRIPA|nr:hypothetical protein M6B38_175170 [Iris pallida]
MQYYSRASKARQVSLRPHGACDCIGYCSLYFIYFRRLYFGYLLLYIYFT